MTLNQLSIQQAHEGLVKRDFSATELTKVCLDQIEKRQPEINAFITITAEEALNQAKEVDKKIVQGEKIGILEGIPAAIKDNILIKKIKTTAGSKILENYKAAYDATVIEKLRKVNAVFLGKTNMDEFAMGSSGETSAFGPTKNPHDLDRVPGGSSSGSAAAVADQECIFALGSDTGGSVRQPASFCGVVGFKPTYGAVSRYGLIAMASSLDQISPITKTVEDAEIVFEAIKGKDEKDSTSLELKHKIQEPEHKQIKDLRIGVPREYFIKGMDREIEQNVREVITKLEQAGAKIEEVNLRLSPYALAVYYIIMPAEVSANLARFDGIRYGGIQTENQERRIENLYEFYCQTRGQGFGDEVRRRIMLGTYVLSSGYYEAYYHQAQKVRVLISQEFKNIFDKADVLLTPATPTTAFRLGEKFDDPLTMYLSDIFTVSVNVAGLPAISVPCSRADNLPIGVQIIGPVSGDKLVLEAGKSLEEVLTL